MIDFARSRLLAEMQDACDRTGDRRRVRDPTRSPLGVEPWLAKIEDKYKPNEKNYDALDDEIDKEVRKTLKSAAWITSSADL